MSNLLGYDFSLKGIHILEFGGHIDGNDADRMNILVAKDGSVLMGGDKNLVEDCDGEEIGSGRTFEAAADFYEPIKHLSSIFFGDLMTFEWISTSGLTNLLLELGVEELAVFEELLLLQGLLDAFELVAVQFS
jgi:hypothetical protein